MRDLIPRRNRNNLPTWGDFEREFDRLRRGINDLFDFDFGDEREGLMSAGFAPDVDVVENPDNVEVRCDLPGVSKDDIDVSISGNTLMIKGEKKGEEEKKDARVYRKESWYGSFQRNIPLPSEVDAEKVDAQMKDGVLSLSIPKKEEAKQKQINVNVK
jgi:HSP20 family protein